MEPFTLTVVFIVVAMLGYARGRHDESRKTAAAIDKSVDARVAVEAAKLQTQQPAPEFKAPVAIGQRFRYLGLEMLCTSHSFSMPMSLPMACVKAEYVADGVVRMAVWPVGELEALQIELNRAGAAA